MAHTTKRATPEPAQPILDVSDIDEALHHTSMVGPRNDQWWRWTDALLDQRNRLAKQRSHTWTASNSETPSPTR